MASSNSEDGFPEEPPRKRPRLSSSPRSPSRSIETAPIPKEVVKMVDTIKQTVTSRTGFQPEHEARVGILHFVNSENPGFTGTLKQRYTDFLVNEIATDGTIVHLTDDRAPRLKAVTKESEGQASKPLTDLTNGLSTTSAAEVYGKSLSTEIKLEESTALSTPTKSEDAFIDASVNAKPTLSSPAVPTVDSTKASEKIAFIISSEDHELLMKYFGTTLKDELITFHEKILSKPGAKPAFFGSLLSERINDRPLRQRLHHDIRRIFEHRIETEAIDGGRMKFSAAPPVKPHREGYARKNKPGEQNAQNQSRGKLGWEEFGGQFLHFSLYKENKDTMEVIAYLCKMLKMRPKNFAYSGTKDRRAVTVQRVSVYRQHAKDLERLNRSLYQARLGDFKYEKHGLELGGLEGNQFTITLRDCHFGADDSELSCFARMNLAKKVVGQAVEHIQAHGFINYFGLQRFGTFGIGTDEIGKKILKNDFEGAVWAILSFSPESLKAAHSPEQIPNTRIGRGDLDRAWAIDNFIRTGMSQSALKKLPSKFSAENSIIRHLGSGQHKNDYAGALLSVSRNLRTMYVHAYQSLVWNIAASERWSRYGDKIVKGDLVLVDTPAETAAKIRDEVDENGEIVIHPAADDVAVSHDDLFQRARALTAAEAESGQYSIFDIVLPTPGFDIEYPRNEIGDFYKEFMGSDRGGQLDPADMRRKIKDFSLPGSYRNLLAHVGRDFSFEIKAYQDENEQLVETDLEKLQKSRGQDSCAKNAPLRSYENFPNNGTQNNSGKRGGSQNSSGGRGSCQTEFRHSRSMGRQGENAHQPEHQEPAFKDQLKLSEEKQAKLSAWQNLPTKLAADDKAVATAYDAHKLIPANVDDIIQPVYKDTFIETSIKNGESCRTGFRATHVIPKSGNKEELKVESAPAAIVEKTIMKESKVTDVSGPATLDAMKVDKFMLTAGTPIIAAKEKHLNTSFEVDSLDESQDGGVRLSDEVSPTKIAVIVKFALGTSQYATMALRELMKLGGVKNFKPNYSSGR